MTDNKRVDHVSGVSTVGHEWDGIEELDTPMPRWWLWTLYLTIVWAIGYVILYPAWPLINGATKGTLGWSSRGQLEQEMEADRLKRAPITAAIARTPIAQIVNNPQLNDAAIEGGRSAFKVHCVQCHGSGAAGAAGYPNLNDDDWLWGGNIEEIHYTIMHGARNPDLAQTRQSLMPAFGQDGILQPAEIQDVVSYVRFISGQEKDSRAARRGAALFTANCAVCHGPAGHGDRSVGAPSLTDPIWLYGGDRDAITRSVANSRRGVMPAWEGRLDPVTTKMLAVYVHSLGGGEAMPQAEAAAQAAPAPAPAQTSAPAAAAGTAAQGSSPTS